MSKRSQLWRYCTAVFISTFAIVAEEFLRGKLGDNLSVFLLCYPAVFAATWLAGTSAGLISTFLIGTAAFYLFIPPYHTWSIVNRSSFSSIIIFTVMGILFSILLPRYQQRQIMAELKPSEQALRLERDFLSSILDTAGSLVVVLDRQGKITLFNRACEKIIGYSAKEVLGRIFWEFLIPPEDMGGVKETWNSLTAGHFPNTHENYWLHRDGSRRFIAWSNTVMLDETGQVERIIATGIDITERKQIEESLRRSEEKFKLIAANMPDHVLIQDADLRYVTVINPQLGLTEQDMLGKTDFDILAKDDAEKLTAIKKKVIETGESIFVSTPLLDFKGEMQYFEGSYIPRRNASGSIDGLIGYFRNVTYNKLAEARMARLSEQRQMALDSAHMGWWHYDLETHLAQYDKRYQEIHGISYSQSSDEEIISRLHRDDQPLVWAAIKTATNPADPQPYSVEYRIHRNDDSIRWIEAHGVAEFDGQGKERHAKSLIGTVVDITERKHNEDDLRQLNRTLQALSNTTHAIMRTKDENEYLNEVCRIIVEDCGQAMAWIGYAAQDESKTIRPVASAGFEQGYLETLKLTWADTERGRGPTGTTVRTGKPTMCRNMQTDPAFKPWREEALKRGYASSLVLPLSKNDKPFGAINIYAREPDGFSDTVLSLLTELANRLSYGITTIQLRAEHSHAQELLQINEEKLRTLFTILPVGVSIVDKNHRLTDANPALAKILGLSMDELLSGHWKERKYFNTDGTPMPADRFPSIRAVHEQREIRNIEIGVQKEDGTTFWENVSAAPLPNSNVAIVTMDITERKNMERELRSAIDSREEFLSIASHELKTPLTSLQLQLTLLSRLTKKDSAATNRRISSLSTELLGSSIKLGRLLDDLLDITRIRMGKLTLDKQIVDLKAAVSDSISFISEEADEKRINITLDAEQSVVGKWDPIRINQIISNLLSNAIKYGEGKSIEITVVADHKVNHAKLMVRDYGMGIPHDLQKTIFQRFERAVSGTKISGLGLGLYIVRQIAEAHGGSVSVESEPGKGSLFVVNLPLEKDAVS